MNEELIADILTGVKRKIAISHYGGFGLSELACKWLIEHKGWTVYDDGNNMPKNPVLTSIIKIRKEDSYMENLYITYNEDDDRFREHPDIIEVIETLGTTVASDSDCEIKIVEIPMDIEWTIEDYNGSEWVAENHRTWSLEEK